MFSKQTQIHLQQFTFHVRIYYISGTRSVKKKYTIIIRILKNSKDAIAYRTQNSVWFNKPQNDSVWSFASIFFEISQNIQTYNLRDDIQ